MLNRVLGGVTGCDVGVTEEENGEEEKEGGGDGGKEEEEKGKIGAGRVNEWEAKAP